MQLHKKFVLAIMSFFFIGHVSSAGSYAVAQQDQVRIVALGDSYTAGNGALDYEDRECWRSRNAYVQQFAALLTQQNVSAVSSNNACSNAVIADVGDQLVSADSEIRNADIVVMSIGGNNANFSKIVRECLSIERLIHLQSSCIGWLDKAIDVSDRSIQETRDLLLGIRAINQRAEIVLVGYPYLIAKDCFGVAMGNAVRSLQSGYSAKSDAMVADLGDDRIHYLSLLGPFSGGVVCGSDPQLIRGSMDTAPTNYMEWWHPNKQGHERIAIELVALDLHEAPHVPVPSAPEPTYQLPPPAKTEPGYVDLPFECGAIVPFVSTYGTFNHGGGSYTHGHALDMPMPEGIGVVAPEAGVVEVYLTTSGYGKYVDLLGESGIRHRFAHLAHTSVSSGEYVTRGQRVGLVGSTGASTGPHLHYEHRDAHGQIPIELGGPALVWGNGYGSSDFRTTIHALVSANCGAYGNLGSYDTDSDGTRNDADECPNDPGSAAMNGCPDSDSDGVSDLYDGCISLPGPASNNGCPVDDDIMLIRPDAGKFDLYVDTNQVGGHDIPPFANWGLPGDEFFTGHFNSDLVSDTLLVRESNGKLDWYFDTNMATPHEVMIAGWGLPGDEIFIADFDQDHQDDDILLVREYPAGRLSFYFDKDQVRGHEAVIENWGNASDQVIIGNFDNDPDDDILLVRENPNGKLSFFFETNQVKGDDGSILNWGNVGDTVLIGDFDNDPYHDDDILLVRQDGSSLDWYFEYGMSTPHESKIDNWGKPSDDIRIANFGGDEGDDVMLIRFDGSKYDFFVDLDQVKGHDIDPAIQNWGLPGDTFFIGEFDGDLKADIMLMRPVGGELHWFIETNMATPHERSIDGWGRPGDDIRIADFDGS